MALITALVAMNFSHDPAALSSRDMDLRGQTTARIKNLDPLVKPLTTPHDQSGRMELHRFDLERHLGILA
jgi:hypothetical protein